MEEKFVEINGVSTKIITFGRWIDDSLGNTNRLILFIPGNPGMIGFYKKFAETLHDKTNIPVWCVGHAGHNYGEQTETQLPKFNEHPDLYGLRGQVQHKIDFFRKYISEDTKVYLVGHSIGSYMALEMLDDPYVKSTLRNAYFLFPTIEHMAVTSNGKFLNTLVRPIVPLILFLTWVYTILPTFLANAILYIYMMISNIPWELHSENIRELLKPGLLKRVFFLAFEEMDQVKERNDRLLRENITIIKLYYGENDKWAPREYFNKIREDLLDVNAELCNIDHTFIFHNSATVARTLAYWILP
ncbi:hypothetical protein ABEB36_012980 [Hypothenemus hampei]|uniref:Lipid droplet-associated hydrolase n=1 Tax=Hypothenemus hampei TaxID=57062 RepID=A0ABD1E6E6_HYPHA